MKVRHDEGVANRIGPEPCVGIREDDDEASAGERIGQLWSRESLKVSGADVVGLTEGNMDGRAIASARPTRRGQRHWHVWKHFAQAVRGGHCTDRVGKAGGHSRRGTVRAGPVPIGC